MMDGLSVIQTIRIPGPTFPRAITMAQEDYPSLMAIPKSRNGGTKRCCIYQRRALPEIPLPTICNGCRTGQRVGSREGHSEACGIAQPGQLLDSIAEAGLHAH